MTSKINYKAFIPYFICITTYLFAAILNSYVIEQILNFKEVPSGTLDSVYYYDISGYVIAGLILFVFGNYFSIQKIVIFNLFLYIISVYNIGFSEFSGVYQKIYPMICSETNLVVITSLLYYIFSDKNIDKEYSLTFFLFSICIAYFFAQLNLFYIFPGSNSPDLTLIRILVITNILPITIFLCVFVLSPGFHILKSKTINSLFVLKNVDLELLASFVIFYIIMAIFYNYEVYKFTDNLLMISISNIRYYILLIMLLASVFVPGFFIKYNAHKMNMVYILILLFMFLSMPFWGTNIILSSICWFFIALFLCLYFYSNLLILTEKFTSFYLQLAIILYMLAGAIGYFCSYIVAENVENADDEYNFLISINLILFSTLAYYLYSYKKNNLEKW